jgi:uncharacterized protein
MDPVLISIVILIIFIATFTKSTIGFGDAVIAMPLLALVISMRVATPLVAFMATTTTIIILLKNWHIVDIKATWRLVLASCVGIPIGLFFLKSAPEGIMKVILGLLIMSFGLYKLMQLQPPKLKDDKFALTYLFGLIAGITGGAYNTNGPPIVVYASLRRWAPEKFRATLQGYFLPTGFFIFMGHGLAGLWTTTVLSLYVFSLPTILLGIFLGGKLHKSIPQGKFDLYINLALILMGGLLIIKVIL